MNANNVIPFPIDRATRKHRGAWGEMYYRCRQIAGKIRYLLELEKISAATDGHYRVVRGRTVLRAIESAHRNAEKLAKRIKEFRRDDRQLEIAFNIFLALVAVQNPPTTHQSHPTWSSLLATPPSETEVFLIIKLLRSFWFTEEEIESVITGHIRNKIFSIGSDGVYRLLKYKKALDNP